MLGGGWDDVSALARPSVSDNKAIFTRPEGLSVQTWRQLLLRFALGLEHELEASERVIFLSHRQP